MADQPEATTDAPTGLSKEEVLSAAISLADDGGIQSLSMRNLARRLEVGVMTLYYYVKDKSEIIDGIVDMVVREIELSPGDGDWRSMICRTATSAHRALLRHPWAASLMFSAGDGPARLDYMESLLGTLRQAGFSAEITHRAYHALDSHIIGFTLWETSIPYTAEELNDLAGAFLQDLRKGQYPYIAEHIATHLGESSDDSKKAFQFGLDLILDGLEKLRPPL
jgi:AcrR family transcriptional regulator